MKRLHHSMRRGLVATALGVALLHPAPGRADFDLNGGWAAVATVFGITVNCTLNVVQVATDFDATGNCDLSGFFSISGTIDPMTGVFSASGSSDFFCNSPGSLSISGTASDNSNFIGTINCAGLAGPFVGSRCGNGVIDDGEECDAGNNGQFGTCCLEGCVLQEAGVPCREGFQCVPSEVCDGVSGVCPYNPSELDGTPCDDGNPCFEGTTCSNGNCTNGTNEPIGTPCADSIPPCIDFQCNVFGFCDFFFNDNPCDDGDQCTTADSCLQGLCAAGPPLECTGCETCDSSTGCVAVMEPVCQAPVQDGSTLSMRQGGSSADNRLLWRWLRGSQVDLLDFGDPRTGTTYTFCVYDEDDQSPTGLRLLANATLPGADPNWSPTSKGYRYADRTRAADGLEAIRLKSGAAGESKIILRAKGADMSVAPLPATPPITVQLKADNGNCWQAEYTAMSANSDEKLKAKGGL